ncbi:MAG TPA: DUF1579 family protein [Kofleriaceae bacterium]|nr:DUF1579 family protein [Kofleriaceae bacterium]
MQARLTELFAGVWRGDETLYPSPWDPDGGPATATWTVTPAADGCMLLVDYVEERAGKPAYRGHGVHGYDTAEGCFVVYWFDSSGTMPKHGTRARLDGTRYTYETERTRMTYEWTGDVFTFRIDVSPDGGATWAVMQDGRYTRV